MEQEQEDQDRGNQDREDKTGGITPWLVAVLVVAAVFVPWGRLFSGHPAVYEMRVGSTVMRVPRPKNALPAPEEGAAELGFTIGDANKAENVGYFFSNADAEIYTAEEFSELLGTARKQYSRLGGMFKDEYVKQIVLQQVDIPLKRFEAKQYEKDNVLVMTVEGNMDYYGSPRHVSCAQLLFLLRDRPYRMTVIAIFSSGSHRDALREAWKWHGAIVAANTDGS